MMTGLMGVITFGVIAGIGLLTYLAVEYTERKEKEKRREATESDWKKILAEYLGKSCEVNDKRTYGKYRCHIQYKRNLKRYGRRMAGTGM